MWNSKLSPKIKAKELERKGQSPLSLLEWLSVLVVILEALLASSGSTPFPDLITGSLGWLSQRLQMPTKSFQAQKFLAPAEMDKYLGTGSNPETGFSLSPETTKRLDKIYEKILDINQQRAVIPEKQKTNKVSPVIAPAYRLDRLSE